MRGPQGHCSREQDQQAYEFGSGLYHPGRMLPKATNMRHLRAHNGHRQDLLGSHRPWGLPADQPALDLLKKRYLMDAAPTRISEP